MKQKFLLMSIGQHLEIKRGLSTKEIIRLNKLVEGYRNELLNILENRKYWIKQ